jgi:hypothetical protein
VETKVVLPLFQHLGYPENNRRGKYPLKNYSPGKQGRKPEIDQVYFAAASDKPAEQNADTALVIVEAKEPQIADLEDAIQQARFYGEHLTPPFLVVTNGHRLVVLKRRRFRGDELVLDMAIDDLKDEVQLIGLYDQLNFDIVKHVKVHTEDVVTHEQYVRLERGLRRYPDLQALLDKDDFKPSLTREDNRLTVVHPKVAIVCELPVGFGEGSCKIEFSNIKLGGLSIYLDHRTILRELMIGLHTQPHWHLRHFLSQVGETFEARLGQTKVLLSEVEARDLCKCVDEVCQEYKQEIVATETTLETWNFYPTQVEDIRGFHLLSVKQWLWDLMQKFSWEFDWSKGDSEWHMFDAMHMGLRIDHKKTHTHAYIWPKVDNYHKSHGYIELVYEIPTWLLKSALYNNVTSWSQVVGPRGIWTASYTKNWLVQRFIPRVLEQFPWDANVRQFKPDKDVHDEEEKEFIPLDEISETKQLGPYVRMVEHLLWSPSIRDASKLREYYAAMTELARRANSDTFNLGYVIGKTAVLYYEQHEDEDREDAHRREWDYYNDVLGLLYKNVERIKHCIYEEYSNVDLITRIFAAIIEQGDIEFTQAQLNAAKRAMIPIWELYRFEYRYLYLQDRAFI